MPNRDTRDTFTINEPIETIGDKHDRSTLNQTSFLKRLPFIPAILLLVAATVILASTGWLPEALQVAVVTVPNVATTASAQTQTAAATPENPPGPRITAELLVISPRGFEQTTISRPAGRYLFAIVNKGLRPNMVLRLQSENRTILQTIEMPRNRRRASIPITLEPGRYSLFDLTRPEIVCNIEITPQAAAGR